MKKLRFAKYLVPVLVLLPVALLLHFYLPRSIVVELTSTEVHRMDRDSNLVGQTDRPTSETRDVYFLYTSYPGTDDSFVLRNEDTGWGFPFYFKFNSADLNAKAARLANRSEPTLAKVRYYGFRIQLLSMFPNVLSIDEATAETGTFPWFRVIFLGSIGLIAFYAVFMVRRIARRRLGA